MEVFGSKNGKLCRKILLEKSFRFVTETDKDIYMDFEVVLAIIFASLAAIAVIWVCLWLFLITPRSCRRKKMEKFKAVKYAHRGLFNSERAENSLSAFKAAVDAGFGIELDVRLTSDGKLVVFHDPTLTRVCGVEGKVREHTAEELAGLSLSGTGEGVPTLAEVLALVDGAVPLLIEMKQDPGESGVGEALAEEIKGYNGPYIVESFNPMALRALKKCRPDVLLGMLSMEYSKDERYKGKMLYTLLEKLMMNFLARPDFISYDHRGYKVPALRFVRRVFGTPLLAWTIKSFSEEQDAVCHGFDTVIFEGYIPEK